MRTVTAAVVAAAVLVAGCGGDDENGQEDEPQVDSTDVSDPGVTLVAEARREGSRVVIDYTLANPGVAPVGMVDVDVTMDGLEPLDGGAYRVSFLRSTADPSGGEPLPDLQGRAVPERGEVTGTARVTGEFEEVPPEVELCIEVVTQGVEDAGDGIVTFPYGDPDTPPVLACSGRVVVPEG